METGGLVAHAFKILLSNADVMMITVSFMLSSTVLLVSLRLKAKGQDGDHYLH